MTSGASPPTELEKRGTAVEPGVYRGSAAEPHAAAVERLRQQRMLITAMRAEENQRRALTVSTASVAASAPHVQTVWQTAVPLLRLPSEQLARAEAPNLTSATGPTIPAAEADVLNQYAARTAAAERALRRLQRENDGLKRSEIDSRTQRRTLEGTIVRLRTELENMGSTVMDQTVTLKAVSQQMELQRRDPYHLVKSRREGATLEAEELSQLRAERDAVAAQLKAVSEELAGVQRTLEEQKDRDVPEEIEKEGAEECHPHDSTSRSELRRMVLALDPVCAQLAGSSSPPCASAKEQCESVFHVKLEVLSCISLRYPRCFSGSMNPYAIVIGPLGTVLAKTGTQMRTTAPSFEAEGVSSPSVPVPHGFHAISDTNWTVTFQVWSQQDKEQAGAEDGDVLLSSAVVPVNALLSARTRRGGVGAAPSSSLHTVALKSVGLTEGGEGKEADAGFICFEAIVNVVCGGTAVGAQAAKDASLKGNADKVKSAALAVTTGTSRTPSAGALTCVGGAEVLVQVLSARGLLNRAAGEPSNPYVVVLDESGDLAAAHGSSCLTTPHEVMTTSVVKRCSEYPVWHAALAIHRLRADVGAGNLLFRVYDKCHDGDGEGDFLGEARIAKSSLQNTRLGEGGGEGGNALTLILQPRAQEPLDYIRQFEHRLGSLTVRCCRIVSEANAPRSVAGISVLSSTPPPPPSAVAPTTADAAPVVTQARTSRVPSVASCAASGRSELTGATAADKGSTTHTSTPPLLRPLASAESDSPAAEQPSSSGAPAATDTAPAELKQLSSAHSEKDKDVAISEHLVEAAVKTSTPLSPLGEKLRSIVAEQAEEVQPLEVDRAATATMPFPPLPPPAAVPAPPPSVVVPLPLPPTATTAAVPSTTLELPVATATTPASAASPSTPLSSPSVSMRIYVREGKNLLENGDELLDVLGHCDPRVQVCVGEQLVYTVPEVHAAVKPTWTEEQGQFTTVVRPDQVIKFIVQDVNVSGVDAMGTAVILGADAIHARGPRRLPVMLSGEQFGTLLVEFEEL